MVRRKRLVGQDPVSCTVGNINPTRLAWHVRGTTIETNHTLPLPTKSKNENSSSYNTLNEIVLQK